jgi:hypothetical protein
VVTAVEKPVHARPTTRHAQILRGAAIDQHAVNRANATADKAIEARIMFAPPPHERRGGLRSPQTELR